jgi:excisionase family DNA binding protein
MRTTKQPPERVVYFVSAVAAMLGVGRSTVYDAINRGEIAHIRIGHRVVLPKHLIDAMLEPATKHRYNNRDLKES